jgi:hypothetical protein
VISAPQRRLFRAATETFPAEKERSLLMTYTATAEHWLTYALAIGGILYVFGLTATFMRRAWKHALKIGFTRERLWKIVRISLSCALVPSIAVLIGFLLLAPLLGIPLSWWRLSIVGNTAYEIMATNIALNTAGASTAASATGNDYILVMYVMAIGIIGGMAIAPLLSKSIQKGAFKRREKDQRWSALSNSTYTSAILIVFAVPMLLYFSVSLLTLVTSAVFMASFKQLVRKYKLPWLDGLAFTASTFAAMSLSVLWEKLFQNFVK